MSEALLNMYVVAVDTGFIPIELVSFIYRNEVKRILNIK